MLVIAPHGLAGLGAHQACADRANGGGFGQRRTAEQVVMHHVPTGRADMLAGIKKSARRAGMRPIQQMRPD